MSKLFTYSINTSKTEEFININSLLRKAIKESGIESGTAIIFSPHTTAGITINENSDPDVVRDILVNLDRVFPIVGDYMHIEGNSHAHIKTSLMGSSANVIVHEGSPLLGIWQGVYFCEFDGPRSRKVHIKLIEG
ncbi:secondary thiamine-phosphate synthase enzyme YjbQ [Clostridium sp. MSJ-11]|uniref:Secondary thiamine-phosphate synthase enzyme YjbQ n=1 Tax=Clostridium mobile TaxID=2841512 RepID=A0ABS6EEX8_9CLOT|nr:secondary thiamine-phosphate synthase enzyme YjbQ [Clostridium mobile]MBU5483758.1 secondary thiamine-phosphate synthase enzyme YjbQ [Clostridium mobile]